jgi:hypothetical protein
MVYFLSIFLFGSCPSRLSIWLLAVFFVNLSACFLFCVYMSVCLSCVFLLLSLMIIYLFSYCPLFFSSCLLCLSVCLVAVLCVYLPVLCLSICLTAVFCVCLWPGYMYVSQVKCKKNTYCTYKDVWIEIPTNVYTSVQYVLCWLNCYIYMTVFDLFISINLSYLCTCTAYVCRHLFGGLMCATWTEQYQNYINS